MPIKSFVSKTVVLWKRIRTDQASRTRRLLIILSLTICWISLLIPQALLAEGFDQSFSGYLKSFNFFTKTSGFVPAMVDNPLARVKDNVDVFSSLDRIRIKEKVGYEWDSGKRIAAKVDYDQQAYFGSFVGTGDSQIMFKQTENRQFLDLSQTFVKEHGVYYEQRLYRATISYDSEMFSVEVGRQQIPWGVGRFFTPTDLFNPFNPTQLEIDERDGVDAVNTIVKDFHQFKTQLVYTPDGKELHPQRYLARISRDIKGYELGVLGGRVKRDEAVGCDVAGNLKDMAVRGEFLYRITADEPQFFKFVVNADYNFPHNIYALLEYYFNGEGRLHPKDYQMNRYIRGDIQQLSKNYLALSLGHDLTPLLRIEDRTILNINDQSVFNRPEIQYEIRPNLMLNLAAQLFLGDPTDEYGQPRNIFQIETKYSF